MKHCLPRVLLGGSWYGFPRSARVADRRWGAPVARSSILGLRLVRSKR